MNAQLLVFYGGRGYLSSIRQDCADLQEVADQLAETMDANEPLLVELEDGSQLVMGEQAAKRAVVVVREVKPQCEKIEPQRGFTDVQAEIVK